MAQTIKNFKIMKHIPNKIFLNIGYEPEKGDDFNDLEEVTWCADKVNDNDIEYRRKPIWHVLITNPNDLPNKGDVVMTCNKDIDAGIIYEIEHYYPENWELKSSEKKMKRVLAWMYIPKFKD